MLKKAEINLHLTQYNQNETNDQIYRQAFNAIKDELPIYTFHYTNGSKTSHGTGAAVITDNNILQFHLPNTFSTFSAKTQSILQAILNINNNNTANQKIAICTDSLSSIQKIQETYQTNPTITHIQQNIHTAIRNKNKIKLTWIPSHSGLPGNEKAVKATKEARNFEPFDIPTPAHDFRRMVKTKALERWNEDWRRSNDKLKDVKEDTKEWPTRTSRNEQIKITRLRIGHTLLTHKYLFDKTDPPSCDSCNVPLTVKHIITQCQKYLTQRTTNFIPNTLADALKNTTQSTMHIIKFLKDTNLYNKI